MKTPMQELIEWLNDYPTNVPTIHKSAVISKAESLLEKEKEQMLKTFTESRFISRECAVWNCEGDRRKWESFEHYYNETFNTEEK
jgi:ribosome-associated toxin RatA of RatAB toxin-antitoxin module